MYSEFTDSASHTIFSMSWVAGMHLIWMYFYCTEQIAKFHSTNSHTWGRKPIHSLKFPILPRTVHEEYVYVQFLPQKHAAKVVVPPVSILATKNASVVGLRTLTSEFKFDTVRCHVTNGWRVYLHRTMPEPDGLRLLSLGVSPEIHSMLAS